VLLNNDAVPAPGFVAALRDHLAAAPADVAAVTGRIVLAGRWMRLASGPAPTTDARVLRDHAGDAWTPSPDGEERLNSTGVVVDRDGNGADRDWLAPVDRSAPVDVFGASGGAAAFRRTALDDVGLLDESLFMYYEDTELAWRLRRRGWRVQHAAGAVVHHDHSASSGVQSPLFVHRNARNRLVVALWHAPWDTVVRAAVRTAGRVVRRVLAGDGREARLVAAALADVLGHLPRHLARRLRETRHASVPRRAVDTGHASAWDYPGGPPDDDGPGRKEPRVPQLSVLVDGTAVPRDLGGVGRYVEGVVSHLAASDPGLDVHLVVRPVHAEHFAAVAPDVTVHRAPAWTDSVPLRFAWEQTGLPALARRLHADVLHSPHYTFPLTRRGGSVVTLHDATFFSNPEWHSRLKRTFFTWWSRRSLRSRPVVVVPSAATATEAARVVSGIRADVRVAPLGVDRARFHEPSVAEVEDARIAAGLPDDAEWIAFLGTIEPRKNVPALLDAYAAVRAARAATGSPTPWLVLSGARGWDDDAVARLDALQDADHVVEAGYLPIEDLSGFLGGAAFVVYPSLGEGFGLPVVEAMATGACVVTTRRLSLPEVGGDAAVYTEPDTGAVAATIAALLDDPDRVATHRRAALERAGRFTWDATAEVHAGAYRAVAARTGAARSDAGGAR